MRSTSADRAPARFRNDWDATVKLAIVVSVVAALFTIALAGHVAAPVLILAVVGVGATLSWRQSGRRRLPAG